MKDLINNFTISIKAICYIIIGSLIGSELLTYGLYTSTVTELIRDLAVKYPEAENTLQELKNTEFLLLIFFGAFTALAVTLVIFLLSQLTTSIEAIKYYLNKLSMGDYGEKIKRFSLSELNELVSEFGNARRRLKQSERVRTDFVSNVSHELKTPITSIKAGVETLLDGGIEDKEEAENFLKIISKQSDRLSALIEDLLTIGRLETDYGQDTMIMAPELLSDLFDSVKEDCSQRANEKNMSVSANTEGGIVINVDRALFEVAIRNLVDNAIRYSQEGTPIYLSGIEKGDKIIIEVLDQGSGIDEKHLPRLFERFYRVDKARSRASGGTGLGLSIVKHIVGVHSGTIKVESKMGQGTKFTITLPKPE